MAGEKAYKAADRIIIENAKTGESYGVTGAAFDAEYAPLGFRAVSFEDGAPLRPTKGETEAASRSASAESENVGPAGVAVLAPSAAPESEGRRALLERARKMKIRGRAKMSKADLQAAIDAANVQKELDSRAAAETSAAESGTSPVPTPPPPGA